MTSQLNVDAIVDKAGSGGTNVKVANTSTYVSDGGNVTQNTVQGLAKVWGSYNLKDNTAYDAFNVSSNQDLATGRSQFNFTNSLNAIDYSVHATSRWEIDTTTQSESQFCSPTMLATGSVQTTTEDNAAAGAAEDARYVTVSVRGDLA